MRLFRKNVKAEAPAPRWRSILIGLVCLVCAGLAAWRGLMINIDFATSEGAAADIIWIYAFADVGEFLLPLIISAVPMLFGHKIGLRGLWGVCIAISCFCIFSTSAEMEAKKQDAGQNVEQRYTNAKESKADAEAILRRADVAGETMTAADLARLAETEGNLVRNETARGGCRDKCLEHQKLAASYLTRKGLAETRDKASAVLASASAVIEQGSRPAPGFALTLSPLTGLTVKRLSGIYTVIKSIAPLVLLKLTVWILSPVAGWLLFQSGKSERSESPKASISSSQDHEASASADGAIVQSSSPILVDECPPIEAGRLDDCAVPPSANGVSQAGGGTGGTGTKKGVPRIAKKQRSGTAVKRKRDSKITKKNNVLPFTKMVSQGGGTSGVPVSGGTGGTLVVPAAEIDVSHVVSHGGGGGLSVREFAREMGLSKSAAHRQLQRRRPVVQSSNHPNRPTDD